MREPCVYLLSNRPRGSFYVGVTSDLKTRIQEHKEGIYGGHTFKYGIHKLVWYERYENMRTAIIRKKIVKRWTRKTKIQIVEEANPHWEDLFGLLY